MKKQYLAILVLVIITAGVIWYSQVQKKKSGDISQNTSQTTNSNTPFSTNPTNQIKYSDNPQIIGKELAGLTSIPDKYKPEDTVIDIDALAKPYLAEKRIQSAWKLYEDPKKLFEVEGYGIYANSKSLDDIKTGSRSVTSEYNWSVLIYIYSNASKLEKNLYPFKVISKNLKGYEIYTNRNLTEFVIYSANSDKVIYQINYAPRLPEMFPDGTVVKESVPGKDRPASELYNTVSTFRLLK